MKYQQKSFTVPVAGKVDVGCMACVFGERFHEHDPKCQKKVNSFEAVQVSSRMTITAAGVAAIAAEMNKIANGPQIAPGQSLEEFCDAYQKCNI